MFTPSAADVRRFFCQVYAKLHQGDALEPLEAIAASWLKLHPEYAAELADLDAALQAMQHSTQPGHSSAFLHLSMHLTLSEQCSIDQPRGIRQAIELLSHRRNSLHLAHHEAMECLGTMLWDSQRSGQAPDGAAYLACVQRRATRD